MRARTALLLVVLVALGIFTALNWTAITTPTDLHLVFRRVQAPVGVILLAFTAGVTLLYAVFLTWIEASAMLEGRRFTRELQAQRQLAETAEASQDHGTPHPSTGRAGAAAHAGGGPGTRGDRESGPCRDAAPHRDRAVEQYAERLFRGARGPAQPGRAARATAHQHVALPHEPSGLVRLGARAGEARILRRGTRLGQEVRDPDRNTWQSQREKHRVEPEISTDRYRQPNDAAASGPGSRCTSTTRSLRLTIQ